MPNSCQLGSLFLLKPPLISETGVSTPFFIVVSIDICSESGSMCHLEDHLRENGSKFVKEREKYILVRRESKLNIIIELISC